MHKEEFSFEDENDFEPPIQRPYFRMWAIDPSGDEHANLTLEVDADFSDEDLDAILAKITAASGIQIERYWFDFKNPYLQVECIVGPAATDEMILKIISDLSDALDTQYRAIGGNGLKMVSGGVKILKREEYIQLHLALVQREASDGFAPLDRIVRGMREYLQTLLDDEMDQTK